MTLAAETARVLEEALWAAIVELAEAAHDRAVAAQAAPQPEAAVALGTTADDISHLARAAVVASDYRARSP